MIDIDLLEVLIDRACDRYTATELVDILESLGLVTVRDIAEAFSEQLIEATEHID